MRLRFLGVVLVLGLVAGCGGSDDAGDASSPAPSMPAAIPEVEDRAAGDAAVAATREYLDAFVNGRAEAACALESPRFAADQVQRAIAFGLVEKGATCVDFVKAVLKTSREANPTPVPVPELQVMALEATATAATVRVEYPASGGASPDTYGLVKSGGKWLVDADRAAAPAPTPTG